MQRISPAFAGFIFPSDLSRIDSEEVLYSFAARKNALIILEINYSSVVDAIGTDRLH